MYNITRPRVIYAAQVGTRSRPSTTKLLSSSARLSGGEWAIVDGWSRVLETSESLLESDHRSWKFGDNALEYSPIDACSVWRTFNHVIGDDIPVRISMGKLMRQALDLHFVVDIEEPVGCAEDNTTGSNTRENDSINPLAGKDQLKFVAATSVVSILL
jgi:hypothetical protein